MKQPSVPHVARRFRIVHRASRAMVCTHGMVIEDALAVLGVDNNTCWWIEIKGRGQGNRIVRVYGDWPNPFNLDVLGLGAKLSVVDLRKGERYDSSAS